MSIQYPSGHADPGVNAVILLLEDWAQALESGEHLLRLPDYSYHRPYGEPLWSEEQLDKLISDLDAEVNVEVARAPGTSIQAQAGTDYWRLFYPQRLALAQQLEACMWEHREAIMAIDTGTSTAPGVGGDLTEAVILGPSRTGRLIYWPVFGCWAVYYSGNHVEAPTREEALERARAAWGEG